MPVTNFFTETDFQKLVLNDFGREIILVPVTQSISNFSGKETLTAGTASVIEAYFLRTNNEHDFQQSGLVEVGDAICVAKFASGVKKDDLIYADGTNVEISSIDGGTSSISVVTSTAHGLSASEEIMIVGTTNYDGDYTVNSVSGTTAFVITDASHDVATETSGQINKGFKKFRVKETINYPSVFDNTGGATRKIYSVSSCFLWDENDS